MAICITGSLSKKRDEYIKIIEDNGGSFINSISKKTNILLIGNNVGAVKTTKAKECGTKVITEDEFNQMLEV
jgi:DNA ligase (NAD+)